MEFKMPFILSVNFLDKFKAFRRDYEKRTGHNLSSASSSSSFLCFFGASDTGTRKNQLDFLATVYDELQHVMPSQKEDEMDDKQRQIYIISLRILLVTCLHVKSQITQSYTVKSTNSVLVTLIDEALGVTSANPIDVKTKKLCLQSTEQWLKSGDPSTHDPLFSISFNFLKDKELGLFKDFLEKELVALSAIEAPSNFPIAKILLSAFGTTFALAGTQIGYVLAPTMAGKHNGVATSFIIASISNNSHLFTTGSYVGAVILAKTVTERVLGSLYSISLSSLLAGGFGQAGRVIGLSVGMSLDLGLIIVKNTCNTIGAILDHQQKTDSKLSGLRLTDGHEILAGVDMDDMESITFRVVSSAMTPQADKPSTVKIELIEDDNDAWLEASL